MKTKELLLGMALAAALPVSAQMTELKAGSAPIVKVKVDAQKRGPKISPTHYGIFFEDINHAADGGLYAELIQNRSFEDNDNAPVHWRAVGNAKIELTAEDVMNKAHEKSLRVITSGEATIVNDGYWGMNAVAGQKYRLSFWAKSDKGFKSTVKAQLQDAKGNSLGSVDIPVQLTSEWKKYTAEITATGNDAKAEFALKTKDAGVFQLDVVSLFPPTFKNRENGMRPDLAQMLADMKPKFMRFPGGCFVEGQVSPENAFRWERTIGPIENRPGHKNVNWGYRTTDGIGFHEYLQLAEDLGAKPLYVVNVGIWHGGYTPLDSLQSWIDECMNALEYANGDAKTTKYGALRAKNGHPKPFNIEYLEIGNENYNFFIDNNRDQSIQYPERYKMFYDAIKAKYPNMHCIGNVEAWATDTPKWRNDYPVEMVDEHYYRNPQWFASKFNMYDNYDRNSYKVYTGEYAVTQQFGKIGNLNAALGEAVYMMGMENNSDVVVMNSYAPIFVNENNVAWAPDMIRFNSKDVMGTPSYYVQKLFPANIGTQVLKTECQWSLPEVKVDTDKKPFTIGMGSWNTSVRYENPQLIVDGKTVELADLSSWKSVRGEWRTEGNAVTHRGRTEGALFLAPNEFGYTKYTYKVRARKECGEEGFLMVFGYQDADHYQWFNLGGWGNSQSAVEAADGNGATRSQLGSPKPNKIETGRWYDLQVDVDGDNIKAYLDGKLEFETKLTHSYMRGVFASTTIDDAKHTMYVKVVNTGEGAAPGCIDMANVKAKSASVTRLSSESGYDENTMEQPKAIVPVEASAKVTKGGKRVTFDVPAYSVNIVKIKY